MLLLYACTTSIFVQMQCEVLPSQENKKILLRSKRLRSYLQKLAHYADYSYENCM